MFVVFFRPRLVCLDLGDCEFQDQWALLDALSTLPRLRSLVLEGNPFTLACCYPGLAVDRLPHLFYLDSTGISPQERDCFRGLAQMSSETVDFLFLSPSCHLSKENRLDIWRFHHLSSFVKVWTLPWHRLW